MYIKLNLEKHFNGMTLYLATKKLGSVLQLEVWHSIRLDIFQTHYLLNNG